VITLFEQQHLVARQDRSCELHDALSDLVSHWLDVQSNMRHSEQEKPHEQHRRIARSV
jgi:hypothetical protein